jgi:hypothetical protein
MGYNHGMDRANDLISIVQREVADYHHVRTWQASSYYVEDHNQHIYMVITVPDLPRPFPARVIVMARVVGDQGNY